MRQPNIDKVEIVEPPIGELTKRHGGFGQGCIMGCLFFVVIIVSLIFSVKFYLGKGPGKIDYVPNSFPSSITIYDRENIEHITLIPGKYKLHSLQLASIFPRLLLSPLIDNTADNGASATTPKDKLHQTWLILTAPVDADDRDTIRIEWKNSITDPAFIASYYTNELGRSGYTIMHGDDPLSMSFSNGDISGTLQIADANPRKQGTDSVVLTVSYPSK